MQAFLNSNFRTNGEFTIYKPETNINDKVKTLPALVDTKEATPEKNYTTLPAIVDFYPADEEELVEIDDQDFNTENPDKIDISNPREVTVEVNEAQEEAVNNLVDTVVNHFKGNELLDNVMYKDENGNPKSQVITKKNDDGTYSKITITYDENGNIKEAAAIKYRDFDMQQPLDGYEISFSYNDDGTITAQPNYGWDTANGAHVNIMVYFTPITINQDGSCNYPILSGM